MSVRLEPLDFQQLVRIVQQIPGFGTTVYERRRLLDGAFGGDPHADVLLGQIILDGQPLGVAVEIVKHLADFGQVAYGKEALGVFLNHIMLFVGDEARDFLASLFARYPLDAPAKAIRPISRWRATDTVATVQEKIIGENTLRDVRVLQLALEAARAVALLRVTTASGDHTGTGFMIAPDLLMTNHHVIGSPDEAGRAECIFNYQLDVQGRDCQMQVARGLAGGLFHTNTDLDYTVIQVRDAPDFGDPLRLTGTLPPQHARVAIIQHPGGHLKKVSMQNNQVAYADQQVVQYYTSTLPGSSGSPVFDDDFRVVAIHHSGGMLPEPGTQQVFLRNAGSSMVAVLADLRAHAPAITAQLRG